MTRGKFWAPGKGQIDWVEIKWPRPSQRVDRINKPTMNHYMVITEGEGSAKTASVKK